MDDINKIKPELSKIKKDKHFRIPDGYFDDFSVRLGERIHRESDAGFYERYILTLKPYLAIAALFIGMIIPIVTVPKVSISPEPKSLSADTFSMKRFVVAPVRAGQ